MWHAYPYRTRANSPGSSAGPSRIPARRGCTASGWSATPSTARMCRWPMRPRGVRHRGARPGSGGVSPAPTSPSRTSAPPSPCATPWTSARNTPARSIQWCSAAAASPAATPTAGASWPICAPTASNPAAGPVLLLGAGGAARAVAAALLETGVPVTIANRTPEHARGAGARPAADCACSPWEQRNEALSPTRRYWSTRRRLACRDSRHWQSTWTMRAPGLAVADIVYVPLETPLLASRRGTRPARRRGPGHAAAIRRSPASAPGSAWSRRWTRTLRRFVAADLLPV